MRIKKYTREEYLLLKKELLNIESGPYSYTISVTELFNQVMDYLDKGKEPSFCFAGNKKSFYAIYIDPKRKLPLLVTNEDFTVKAVAKWRILIGR